MSIDRLPIIGDHIAQLLPRLTRKLAEQHSGYPAGGQTTASGSSDRTGETATRHLQNGHERTDTDYLEALHALATLDDIARRTIPNNVARAHAATLTQDRPGCRSCARVDTWNDIRTNGMCRWCNDTLGRCLTLAPTMTGDMPPRSIVDAYTRGIRITETMLKTAIHTDASWKKQGS